MSDPNNINAGVIFNPVKELHVSDQRGLSGTALITKPSRGVKHCQGTKKGLQLGRRGLQ